MKNTEILGRINALLNRRVKLEQQALENGTIIEAEVFEVGQPVFSVDGENKTPLAVGEYVMADGSTLYVTEEGVIGEIATAQTEVVEEEVEAGYKKKQAMAEVPATLEEILTAVVDAIQPKIDEMQAKIDALTSTSTEMKATLSKTTSTRPTTHKPTESKMQFSKMTSNINTSNTEALIMARLSRK
jgi:cytoskeletal protein RodZ